jgi:hypothetical protein
MTPSTFVSAESIGAAVLRRFYSPVVQNSVIEFGIPPQPGWHQAVVRGFLQAASAEKAAFDVLLVEIQMPAFNLTGVPPIDLQTVDMNSEKQSDLIERLRLLKEQKKRVLLLTSSVYSSHLIPGNPTDRYETATGEHLFAITSGPLSLGPGKEYLIDPPCVGTELDRNGISVLGCAYLKASRGYYRRQIKADHYVAIMNSPKIEDYLLMIAEPER